MNADRLVALLDRVADAPDAVGRLRRFVRNLALRGRLVEQDSKDEPASELLRRIAVEKERHGQSHRTRRPRLQVPQNHTEVPYDLPPAWQWTQLDYIAEFRAGRTPPRKEPRYWNTGDFPWVSIADMDHGETLRSTKETVSADARLDVFKREPEPSGTIIMSFKLTIGKVARLGLPAFHNEAIVAIRPYLAGLDPFLFRFLPEFARRATPKGAVKGATLNRDSLSRIEVPLPPLAEQRRIIAKVDELMALCDRLEETRAAREGTRDRLSKASLTPLKEHGTDAAAFRAHARIAVNALPALTARAAQVENLRETILSLAVRGKLVEQDPDDEPATDTLGKARCNLRARARAAKRVRWKDTEPITGGEVEGEMPPGWVPARINDTGLYVNGLAFKPSDWKETGTRIIRIQNLTDPSKGYNFAEGTFPDEVLVRSGDLLVSWSATLDAFRWDRGEGVLNQHIFRVLPAFGLTAPDYLLLLLKAAIRQLSESDHAHGLVMKHINRGPFLNHVVLVPPLAEQHRIVAKFDELMTLCHLLEAGLERADRTRSHLLESTLQESLGSHDATLNGERQAVLLGPGSDSPADV